MHCNPRQSRELAAMATVQVSERSTDLYVDARSKPARKCGSLKAKSIAAAMRTKLAALEKAKRFAHKIIASARKPPCAVECTSNSPGRTQNELDRLRSENTACHPAPHTPAAPRHTLKEKAHQEWAKLTDPAERRTYKLRNWNTLSGQITAPESKR
jgi:hypothetical protein